MTGHWQILGSSRVPLARDGQARLSATSPGGRCGADVKILLRTVPYVSASAGHIGARRGLRQVSSAVEVGALHGDPTAALCVGTRRARAVRRPLRRSRGTPALQTSSEMSVAPASDVRPGEPVVLELARVAVVAVVDEEVDRREGTASGLGSTVRVGPNVSDQRDRSSGGTTWPTNEAGSTCSGGRSTLCSAPLALSCQRRENDRRCEAHRHARLDDGVCGRVSSTTTPVRCSRSMPPLQR